jgi:D-amino peptidase
LPDTGTKGDAMKRVYVMTDIEGVSGVVSWKHQGSPESLYFREARELLTGEINAAVEALLESGVEDIHVTDGHGTGFSNLVLEKINPHCRVLTGRRNIELRCMDSSFDAMLIVGAHASSGTDKGVLSHTFSENVIHMWINDRLVSEAEVWALTAGAYDVPTIFISGDRWLIEEIKPVLPNTVFAPVKEGTTRFSAIHVPPIRARQMIKDGIKEAAAKAGSIQPLKTKAPVAIKLELMDTQLIEMFTITNPRAERLDSRTVLLKGETMLEALSQVQGAYIGSSRE